MNEAPLILFPKKNYQMNIHKDEDDDDIYFSMVIKKVN
jgi:hypothetical protein